MKNDIRLLMESIEGIMDADVETEEVTSTDPKEMFLEVLEKMKKIPENIENIDENELTEALKSITITLSSLVSDDTTELDECGTNGMEPSFDAGGTPNHSNQSGESFPERNGFLGM